MPHLRRQPNSRDRPDDHTANLRAQFQTPPSRQTPSNPIHRPPPSTGPYAVTPDLVPATGHPHPNLFPIFGRAGMQQPPPELMDDEDELGEEYDARGQATAPVEDEDGLDPQTHFDPEYGANDSDEMDGELVEEEIVGDQLEEEEEEEELEGDEDEEMHDREKSPSPLPPNLREISSLASWTVSTSKPGCGVTALRHPSPSQYWQSDGPQPHTLTLHFFKLVAVVRIRVYLDFELDESYTPTKMTFAAGMGGNDLVEFATWEGDGPCGWVDIPLDGVGGRNGGWVRNEAARSKPRSKTRRAPSRRKMKHGVFGSDDQRDENGPDGRDDYENDDPYAGNVLKAMVLQMSVMENHQNGKDTHVRGFQVFACDDSRRAVAAPSASADGRHRRHSARQSLRGVTDALGQTRLGSEDVDTGRLIATTGLDEPDWMGEPVIR
ncbi:hypothetical protein NUU61_006171 [Penicillium alfredii]|uniref:DOC domain-containing protein n=1 Tax=Penicillium alfredii TaxID=1506179 RepID=A0A9W9F0K8_9EURO|nr:uncharacterized protein NUU61_006171 [Penicillium alfredii]KAJ5091301.1 hypothetical protein NUU61_006171 [Penicillium alfredii]